MNYVTKQFKILTFMDKCHKCIGINEKKYYNSIKEQRNNTYLRGDVLNMFGIINKMISPEVMTNALSYEDLLNNLNSEIKLSNTIRLTIKRGMTDLVKGIDFQRGAEIIYIADGITGEELLEALEVEDGSDAKYKIADSYYNNRLTKDLEYKLCFGDQLKVISEDGSETSEYVIMEENSSKSTCTDIKVNEFNRIVKSVDNINRVITVVEPIEGLVCSDLIQVLASKDESIQTYDVQGIEPVFDDALITKHNNFDLVTESEELVVISENKHNIARFKIEFVK